MTDIENKTDGVVYAQLLYRLENGRTPPQNLKSGQVQALLRAIGWGMDRWLEVTGQATQSGSDLGQGTAVVQPHITPHGSREIPVIDMLSAGLGGEGGTIVDHVAIPDEWRGQFAAYRVSGDSMAPHIPDAPPEPRQPQAQDLEDWRAQVRKALKGSQRDVILAADAWAVLSPEGVLDVTFGVSE